MIDGLLFEHKSRHLTVKVKRQAPNAQLLSAQCGKSPFSSTLKPTEKEGRLSLHLLQISSLANPLRILSFGVTGDHLSHVTSSPRVLPVLCFMSGGVGLIF